MSDYQVSPRVGKRNTDGHLMANLVVPSKNSTPSVNSDPVHLDFIDRLAVQTDGTLRRPMLCKMEPKKARCYKPWPSIIRVPASSI